MTERVQPIYGPDGYDERLLGYELRRPVSPEDAEAAIAILREANKPADSAFIAKELTRMRLLTKARPQDDIDLEMMAAIYADEMSVYPADVVMAACRKWTAMETWWPSWAELKDQLEFRMRRRREMLEALERNIGGIG